MKKKYLITLALTHMGGIMQNYKQVTILTEDISHLPFDDQVKEVKQKVIDAIREQLRESLATRAEQDAVEIKTIEEAS